MDSVPVALSVHHFVTSVGAYAGFAAFIALAVLTLLYFAQARETTSLRDRAAELLDRVGQLEARLSHLVAQTSQAGEAPAKASVSPVVQAAPAAARLAALEMPPGAPAGVAAPALAAATRVIPAGIAVRAVASRAAVPAVAAAPASAGLPVAPAPVAADAAALVSPPPARSPGGRSAVPGPAPATAAAAGNGSSHGRAPAPVRPGTTPARASAVRVGAGRPGGPAAPAARRPAARPASSPPERYDDSPRTRTRTFLLVALAVLVVAGGAIAAILLTRPHGRSTSAALQSRSTTPAHQGGVALVKPSTVTVAVLNGTATAGLAHKSALRLMTAGFREGRVATAADQTHTTTLVSYSPGARTEALAVAKTLGVRPTSVRPIDANTEAVACQGAPTCDTTVVVTIGADLAGR